MFLICDTTVIKCASFGESQMWCNVEEDMYGVF
jgi:hypothetical protein